MWIHAVPRTACWRTVEAIVLGSKRWAGVVVTKRAEAVGMVRTSPLTATESKPLWLGFMVAGFFAIAVYFVLPTELQVNAYDLFGVAATVAVITGAIRNKPSWRLPWYGLATGLA